MAGDHVYETLVSLYERHAAQVVLRFGSVTLLVFVLAYIIWGQVTHLVTSSKVTEQKANAG